MAQRFGGSVGSLMVLILIGICDPVSAQQSRDEKPFVEEAIQSLSVAYKERDWEAFKANTSEEGFLEVKRQVIHSTFLWFNSDFPGALPRAVEIRDQLTAVYAQRRLCPTPTIPNMG